ncbi:MAG: hypothetical protein PHG39_05935 [Acidithiobacillus ferrooxidans]|jgi:hypothetical protein|uniref:hypothetical protein n=1 Tax=Acidithiobacillus sp. TaxID=1872118 RepID=UPI0029FE3872|nr:hypothetical protein [Acidithiobacillus ferrooxidans]MDD5003486.1 hypothetical protein [Acidithiobacillus sp.]MDD5378506.1 hypothetical protein [Acidithiobacillus sp.]MDD5575474.1 hypothetical protein [Acidithiobacillus sp.]
MKELTLSEISEVSGGRHSSFNVGGFAVGVFEMGAGAFIMTTAAEGDIPGAVGGLITYMNGYQTASKSL